MSYARLATPLPNNDSTANVHFYNNNNSSMAGLGGSIRPMYLSKVKAPISPTRRRKLLFSYAPDWAITIILAAIFLSLDKVDGYRRDFSLSDTSLRHPHAVHERVPNWALYVICFLVPFCLQPIINYFTVRSWWDFHNGSLGLVLGLALTGSVTQFVKITVGRPRPDILDRCQPPPGAVDPPFKLTNWTICQQQELLKDGFRSFPSGHSSLSFAGLGFLSFYLAGKLHLFDKRGHAGKAWLSLFPFCGAAMVAISRSMDYRHHWQDILVGSLLGTVFAYFSYRQYYPPLESELAHRPYSPRIKDEDSAILPMHVDPHGNLSGGNTSSYKPSGSGTSAPVQRYNSQSPPPNPFVGNSNQGEYQSVGYELNGTVPRPNPALHEVWKEGGDSGYEGTVPRSRSRSDDGERDGDSSSGHGNPTRPLQNQSYPIPLRTTSHQQHEEQVYGGIR